MKNLSYYVMAIHHYSYDQLQLSFRILIYQFEFENYSNNQFLQSWRH